MVVAGWQQTADDQQPGWAPRGPQGPHLRRQNEWGVASNTAAPGGTNGSNGKSEEKHVQGDFLRENNSRPNHLWKRFGRRFAMAMWPCGHVCLLEIKVSKSSGFANRNVDLHLRSRPESTQRFLEDLTIQDLNLRVLYLVFGTLW